MESPFVGGGPTELGDRYGAWYRTIIENPETIRDKRLVPEWEKETEEKERGSEKGRSDGMASADRLNVSPVREQPSFPRTGSATIVNASLSLGSARIGPY